MLSYESQPIWMSHQSFILRRLTDMLWKYPSHLQFLFVFQFIDSDEDNDGYVDTDEEVSNGRVNLLNGSGPPYFHGYLYMKSKCFSQVAAEPYASVQQSLCPFSTVM